MNVLDQIKQINPSAKDPLFRRLLVEDDLGYLREEDSIIGFEIDVSKSKPLSGFALIALQKHTILGFKSDLDEKPRLILFPSMDKLFDESFELLDLSVTKQRYMDSSFEGQRMGAGILRSVVSDLTPPRKNVDLPQGVSEAMVEALINENANAVRNTKPETPRPSVHKPKLETPVKPTKSAPPKPARKEIIKKSTDDLVSELREQRFDSINDLMDYAVLNHRIVRDLANKLHTAALRSSTNPEVQLDVAIQLLGRVYDKIGGS